VPAQEPHRLLARRLLQRAVQTHGCGETQGYSFLADEWAGRLGLAATDFVRLGNPVQAGVTLMRHDPLPTLLEQAASNLREFPSGSLCEVAKGYRPSAEGPVESRYLGLVQWAPKETPLEGPESLFGQLRSLTADLLQVARLPKSEVNPLSAETGELPWAHPVHGLQWKKGNHLVATMARVHPALARELDFRQHQVACVLLDLTALAALDRPAVVFQAPSKFPGIKVDVALSLPHSVACADAEAALRKAGGKLLDSLHLFDLYQGEGLEEGHRSLAFRAVLRAADRTLSDKEEQKFLDKATKAALELGGQVRG